MSYKAESIPEQFEIWLKEVLFFIGFRKIDRWWK